MKVKKFRKQYAGMMALALIVLLCGWAVYVEGQQNQTNQEPLTYNVSVSAVLVPVFATDVKGYPVYDLTEDDLELFINGQSVGFMLNRYQLDEATPSTEQKTDSTKPTLGTTREKRVVFIILDAIFNSLDGFKRGKKIAEKLVEKRNTDDIFIVLQMTPTSGLDYIAGPEPGSTKLIELIRNIPLKNQYWQNNLFSRKKMPDNITYGGDDPRDDNLNGGRVGEAREMNRQMEKMEYVATTKRFTFLLTQFQHAMNTITNPKLVFLITEGISRSAFEANATPGQARTSSGGDPQEASWSQNIFDGTFKNDVEFSGQISNYHLRYLQEVAKSINRGGSVLYTINPQKSSDKEDESISGDMSMNYMARESGGKYFQGKEVDTVVENIKQTTAAYYELSYSAAAVTGKDLELEIKCKRPDVRINTLRYSAKAVPYQHMDLVQKKIFALNAVTGGTWSRMSGTVKRIIFTVVDDKNNKSSARTVEIHIPENMRNRKADIFLIQSDPKTNQVDIKVMNKTLNTLERVTVKINTKKKTNQYIAFIEPTEPFCIYNMVE